MKHDHPLKARLLCPIRQPAMSRLMDVSRAEFCKCAPVRLGSTSWIGVDYDVSVREDGKQSVFSRYNDRMDLFQAQLGVELNVHLHMNVGARTSRTKLMHVAEPGILSHKTDN